MIVHHRRLSDLARLLVSAIAVAHCCGCSSHTSDGLQNRLSEVAVIPERLDNANVGALGLDFAMDPTAPGLPVAKTDLPSPGRINAFEIDGEFRSETTAAESAGGKREVYIIGFVEVDEPSVMLAIDGRTQVLKKGDTYERITVEEIVPPRAKLNCDGVSWIASIYDRRSSANESVARKKSGAAVPPRPQDSK